MEKEPKLNPPEAEEIKIIDGVKYRKVFSGYTVRQYYSHQTPEKGPGPGWDFFTAGKERLAKKYGIKLETPTDFWRLKPEDLPDEPYYEWEEVSIAEQPEIQDFIKDRNIGPEDIELIEKLSSFPKNLLIAELHNLFNMYHEQSGGELERMIKTAVDSQRKELYETAYRFYKEYDWPASWNLIRLLERI